MANTQVRAKLGEEWIDLVYNPETGRYEGYLTPRGTSIHQPGGYFPVTVEAVIDDGSAVITDGSAVPELRLTVRETAAPTLTIVSPPPGYLATSAPAFIFEAVDEEGGSGIDPSSFSLPGAVVEAIPAGYRFTWAAQDWPDGPHTLTASVADYDGNVSAVSGGWVVDTIPPALRLRTPYLRHVVDSGSVLVSGTAFAVSGVEVLVNGQSAGGEDFAATAPLEVGENTITVTAQSGAGWETTETIYIIRLITDRTKADVEALKALQKRSVNLWTDAELEWFETRGKIWGAYTAEAMNRVATAVEFLAGELRKRGYAPAVSPKPDWAREDASTSPQGESYRKNVEAIRDAQGIEGLSEWPIPATLRYISHEGANQLEKALVQTDAIFQHYNAWTAGEITCGEG